PGFEDTRVAALALLVALGQRTEELAGRGFIAEDCIDLPARMLIAALAERDQLLDVGAQVFRLRQGRRDLLMFDQRRRQIGEKGAGMTAWPPELATANAMTHDSCLLSHPGLACEADCCSRRREEGVYGRWRRRGPFLSYSSGLSMARRAAW